MIAVARTAAAQAERFRAILHLPPLPAVRIAPAMTRLAAASDDRTLPRSSSLPSGSAVEAGRPAKPSEPEPCGCPVCTSDCAGIVPCQRKAN